MDDNKMLDDEIHELHTKISELKWKKSVSMIGTITSSIISILGTALFYAVVREFTLPFVAFSSFFPMLSFYSYKVKGELKKANEKKLKHLQKIKQDGLVRDDDLDKTRVSQLEKLEKKQKVSNRKVHLAAFTGLLNGLGGFLACGATFVKPSMVYLSLLGMLGFGISSIVENKNFKKMLQYQTRVDNLKNDLVYGPIYGHPKKKKEKVDEVVSSNSKAIVNPNYLDEVEQYVNHLGDIDVIKTSFQKVKK